MSAERLHSARLDPLGRALFHVTRAVAVIGGILLTAAGILTVVSVLGRYIFDTPIEGDFELVEFGTALSVFAFLPWCQMVRGNVLVDFFTAGLAPRLRGLLDAAGALLFTAIAGLLAVQLAQGGMDMYETEEQTVILEIYRYYTFYPVVFCMGLLTLVALYTAVRSIVDPEGAV